MLQSTFWKPQDFPIKKIGQAHLCRTEACQIPDLRIDAVSDARCEPVFEDHTLEPSHGTEAGVLVQGRLTKAPVSGVSESVRIVAGHRRGCGADWRLQLICFN